MDSKKKTDNKPVSNNVEKKKRRKKKKKRYNKVKKLDVDDKKAEVRKPVRQQPKKEVKVVKEEVEDVKDLEEDVKMLDLGDGSRFVVPRESATAGMSKAYRPPHHRGAKKRGDLPPSQPLGALRRASPQRRNFRKSPGGRRNQRRPYVPKQQQQQQREEPQASVPVRYPYNPDQNRETNMFSSFNNNNNNRNDRNDRRQHHRGNRRDFNRNRYTNDFRRRDEYNNFPPKQTEKVMEEPRSNTNDFRRRDEYTTRNNHFSPKETVEENTSDFRRRDEYSATNTELPPKEESEEEEEEKQEEPKVVRGWGNPIPAPTTTSGGWGNPDDNKNNTSNDGDDDDDAWWSTTSTKQTSALEDEMRNFKTASDRQAERVLGAGASDAERKKFEDRLFSGMDKGLNFDKYDNIPVEVSGRDVPPGVERFDDLDLPKTLLNNIKLAKFTKPTPVQKHALPVVLSGRDIMSCAQTGSGKTAAFLLPIIAGVEAALSDRRTQQQHQHSRFGGHGRYSVSRPKALILAPTRELASQIYDESTKFSYQTRVRPCVVYGGARVQIQMANMRRGCDLLVATPGRLVDLLSRHALELSDCRYLCLDEADRMLDMGFEIQIREIVERFDMPRRGDRLTMMFSATFPQEIQRLAGDFLDSDYVFITVGRIGSTTDNITQRVEFVPEQDKEEMLLRLLYDVKGLTLVFVERKSEADQIEYGLRKRGIPATSIHGDRDQRERESALHLFKTQQCPILVATDVAARGLDIPEVAHVVNFSMPRNIDSYVHRIGRTGRAGNVGLATAFVNEKDRNIVRDLVRVLDEANQKVPNWLESMGGRRGGRRDNRNNFGGRDYRDDGKKKKNKKKSKKKKGGGDDGGARRRGGGRSKFPASSGNDAW